MKHKISQGYLLRFFNVLKQPALPQCVNDKPDLAWAVLTGDALFIGEAGRTDLPNTDQTAENAAILFDSIQNKILPLGDQTLIYPAHGSDSVCGGNIAVYDESTLGLNAATIRRV